MTDRIIVTGVLLQNAPRDRRVMTFLGPPGGSCDVYVEAERTDRPGTFDRVSNVVTAEL
ncbi:MAG: hypothetical protein ACJ8F7_14290 [Gemmataceae bacterium]